MITAAIVQHPASVALEALVDDGQRRLCRAADGLGLDSHVRVVLLALVRCSATAGGYRWVTADEIGASVNVPPDEVQERLHEVVQSGHVLHLRNRRPQVYCPNAPHRL